VASPYWPIPFKYGILIRAIGFRSEGQKRKGERWLTGEWIPARCALGLIDGESPVVGDGDGVADAMQKMTVSSGRRLVRRCSSWSTAEVPLELHRAGVACRGPWHRRLAGNLEERKG
jgi:hypothetical protein